MIKALEIKTSTEFDLVFTNSTIRPRFFSLFVTIGLCFSIHAVLAQFPTAELAIPTGTQIDEPNAEIETQPLTSETKATKHS